MGVRVAIAAVAGAFGWLVWATYALSAQLASVEATIRGRDACVEAVHADRSASADRCEARAAEASLKLRRCEDALEAAKP